MMPMETIFNLAGVLIWTLLAGARLNQIITGNIWLIPIFLHSLLAIIMLIRHTSPVKEAPSYQIAIAWLSAALPLAIKIDQLQIISLRILSVCAVLFSIWALMVLGKSFGVAPADRGLIVQGPYCFVRHPMYLGEVFSIVVLLPGNSSIINLLLLLAIILTVILRINWEETIIDGYRSYTQQVRWRLVPGVW